MCKQTESESLYVYTYLANKAEYDYDSDCDEHLWCVNISQRGYGLFGSSLRQRLKQTDLLNDLEVIIGLCEECRVMWGDVAFLDELFL